MTADNLLDFATSALTASLPASGTGSTSFSVTTGQGTLFPTSNFVVTIGTEVLFISSRTADFFTVGTRGFDHTVAQAHSAGDTVQLSWTAYHANHLWQNVADTYSPAVPPVQRSLSPSAYDNEFEKKGSWTLSPTPPSQTTFTVNLSMSSFLVFDRGNGDFGVYTAYIPFTLSGAFTATIRISQSTGMNHSQTTDQAQTYFFFSNQTNPAASADGGDRFRVDHIVSANVNGVTAGNPTCWVRAATDRSGVYSQLGNALTLSPAATYYLRISYNNSGNWQGYVGDGLTFWTLAGQVSFLTSPVSLGLTFALYNPSGVWQGQTVVVDYVRIFQGSVLPVYGSAGV